MKKHFARHASVWILVAFCLLLAGFLSLRTGSFFSSKNVVNILEANSYRMILAVGMTFVVASGAIDLSVGSILSLSAIVMAQAMHGGWSVALSVAAGLIVGGALGTVNGTLIHLTRINALIVTLATSFLYRGLALMLTLGAPVTKFPQAFRSFGYGDLFGMESGVTMAILLIAAAFPLMYKMRWGHYLTALGGNPEALKRSGVSTGRYRIGCFAAMGVLAALAGVIITARLNSAEPNAGLDMEMDAITAVIMGGTPLSGGSASLAGTAVAVFLLGMIRNGLTLMSVSSYYQQFITGAILLCAVVSAELRQRRQRVG
ncbi:ABC transporter permease [Oscillibacter hominis]|uniref:ABC transporter permease n=1 Tax=Oscillibacter hominis TaxID=2763056 RepID=A0A7G9B541_9FIRM|nr:ABC transporter permease [Oscillibacter hominis]QNL44672.1 ABC transporter permease [Oscillibacter hominis]